MEDRVQAVLDRLLTTKQVAERYGINIKDVQYQIKRGRIKAYKVGGYYYLIHEDDLPEKWPSHA